MAHHAGGDGLAHRKWGLAVPARSGPRRGGATATSRLLTPGRLGRVTALTLGLALLLVIGARPAPLVSGPRPPVSPGPGPLADRTVAPAPVVGEEFVTLPFTDTFGTPGSWVVAARALPLAMTLEQEVVERFGLDTLSAALEVWNDVPGSRFALHAAGLVDARVDHKVRDGVNRVFLDRRDCGDRYLARAHLYPGEVRSAGGLAVSWVQEVDIGICERLGADRLVGVLRHEVAHIAGLGHLCDPGTDCWVPAMGPDNRCRVMNPAAYPCQERRREDEDGFIYLHPTLPRVAGGDRLATVAAVSFLQFPAYQLERRVVLSHLEAGPALQAQAALLAGVLGVPHLVVGDDCTHGPAGEELNRVAADGATVLLVGDVTDACEDTLRVGWQLTTERLPDADALTDRLVAELGGSPDRLVLTAEPDPDAPGVPDVALAVPAAAGLRAPLLTTARDELDGRVADLLEAVPDISVVVLIGDERTVSAEVERQLAEEHGVRVRRIEATDRVEVGLKVSRMRDVFGRDPQAAVLVAADRSADGIAAATLAALTRAAVIPVFTGPASPDVRVSGYLADRVDRGWIVGGSDAIPDLLAIRLNRALDGAL